MAIPDRASTPRSTRGPVRRPNQPATQDKTVNHSRLPTSRESEAAAHVEGTQHFAVDVELQLVLRTVPYSDGITFAIAFPMREHRFRQIAASISSIHNLQRFAGLQLFATFFQPLDKSFGF